MKNSKIQPISSSARIDGRIHFKNSKSLQFENEFKIKNHATEYLNEKEALRLEDTIWRTVGSRLILENFLNRAKQEICIHSILEIGCGSGGDLGLLAKYGSVDGVEQSSILAHRAKKRNIARKINNIDFFKFNLNRKFDLFCLFDVIEHIEDDHALLKRISASASSGSLLLLSVPACPFLYSQHDSLLHHYRRYSRVGLEKLLFQHGYQIVMSSYYVFFLFPFAVISRMKEKLMGMLGRKQTTVQIGYVPSWLNSMFIFVLKMEAYISQLVRLPIGLWIIVLAKKQKNE